jgi:hypothetical protein
VVNARRFTLPSFTAALAVALAVPALASASGSYVSPNPPSAPFDSCAHPRYNSVQAAVEGPGSSITVCAGTYTEQVQIERAVKITAEPGAVLKLPAAPQDSTTPCDTAINPAEFQPNQDELSICSPGKVTITGLTIEALWPAGTCDDSMYGIFVGSGSNLQATGDTIVGAGASPINGCQGGVGIAIGSARTEPSEIATAKLREDNVSGYQKGGITASGEGTTATIEESVVTGAGPSTEIAQNGIQIAFGAVAKIKGGTVTGNECEIASTCGLNGTQSAGTLFFQDGKATSMIGTKLEDNDFGSYFASESSKPTVKPEVKFSHDVFRANRYEGVILDQGSSMLSSSTVAGPGVVGIELLQYAGQSSPVHSKANKIVFEGLEKDIRVYSDKEPGDLRGRLILKNTVVHVIDNESSNFEVVV